MGGFASKNVFLRSFVHYRPGFVLKMQPFAIEAWEIFARVPLLFLFYSGFHAKLQMQPRDGFAGFFGVRVFQHLGAP